VRKPRGFYDKEKYLSDCLVEFIEGRRKTLNKSQSDLGELLNMTQQAFSSRMARRNFTYLQVVKLLEFLQATDEEMLRLMKMQ
jgi:hypothetical protein